MAPVRLPTMDTSGIQRGLEGLGNAIQYQQDRTAAEIAKQQKILAEQQVGKANILLKTRYNDLANKFANDGDLTGDWGQKYRDAQQQNLDEAGAAISDENVRSLWVNEAALQSEDHTQAFRDMQAGKLRERNNLEFQNTIQSAFDTAAKPDTGSLLSAHELFFNTMGPQSTDGLQVVAFKEGATQFYGDGSKAFQSYVTGQDQLALVNTQAQIKDTFGKVGPDGVPRSWGEKLARLQVLRTTQVAAIDQINHKGGGRRISAAGQDKVNTELDAAIAQATKYAQDEATAGYLSTLSQLEFQAASGYAEASVGKYGFVASNIEQWVKQNPDMPTSVKDKANDMIAKYKVAPPEGASAARAEANKKAAIDTQKGILASIAASGGSDETLRSALIQLQTTGYGPNKTVLDAMPFDQAWEWLGSVNKLSRNEDLASVAKEVFKDVKDEGIRNTLTAQYFEEVGGLYNNGNSTYKDSKGAFDKNRARETALKMLTGSNEKWISDIIAGNWNQKVDDNEGVQIIKALHDGVGLGHFAKGSVESSSEYRQIASWVMDKWKANGMPAGAVPVANLGSKMGLPMLKQGNTLYEPIVTTDGGIKFNRVGK